MKSVLGHFAFGGHIVLGMFVQRFMKLVGPELVPKI